CDLPHTRDIYNFSIIFNNLCYSMIVSRTPVAACKCRAADPGPLRERPLLLWRSRIGDAAPFVLHRVRGTGESRSLRVAPAGAGRHGAGVAGNAAMWQRRGATGKNPYADTSHGPRRAQRPHGAPGRPLALRHLRSRAAAAHRRRPASGAVLPHGAAKPAAASV